MKAIKNLSIAGLAISLIVQICLKVNQDNLVVSYGIRTARMAVNLSFWACVVFLALSVFLILSSFVGNRKEKEAIAEKYVDAQEKKRQLIEMDRMNAAYLDSSGNLVEKLLRQQLNQKKEEWGALDGLINKAFDQSIKMDGFQEKLSKLLKVNGAERLNDSEEVLDKAEQYLLQNIRKVLNFMEACDSSTETGVNKVRDSLKACINDNERILSNASDFLIAMTEYLNSQGESSDINSLEEYKNILLQAVEREHGKERNAGKITLEI